MTLAISPSTCSSKTGTWPASPASLPVSTLATISGVGINGQMQLAPGPAGSAVLLVIPLALLEQLEAGAVEQQVQGAAWEEVRPAIGKGATAPAQGGVIRNREINTEKPEDTAG